MTRLLIWWKRRQQIFISYEEIEQIQGYGYCSPSVGIAWFKYWWNEEHKNG